MTLSAATVTAAIAGLSIAGVVVRDTTDLPKSFTKRDCPVLFPHPDEWMQGTRSEPGEGAQYVGQAGVFDAVRSLRYIFLHSPAIAANPMEKIFPAMAARADAIFSAIESLNTQAGLLTVRSVSYSQFGEIAAPPAGATTRNFFYGCFFDIEILEMANS